MTLIMHKDPDPSWPGEALWHWIARDPSAMCLVSLRACILVGIEGQLWDSRGQRPRRLVCYWTLKETANL